MIFRKLKLIFVAVGLLLLIILFLNPIDTFLTEESGEGGQELIVRMLDMGQGDAVLLEKAGEFVLIDSGDVTYRPKFKEYLKKYHVKTLESVIITHPHADHIGGMLMAFGMTDVKRVYDNGDTIPSYIYQTYRKVIDKKQIPRQILKGGQKIQLLPGVSFDVAAPLYKSAVKNENSRQNNNSIAGKLKYGNFTMFFTGDAEKEEEEAILKSGADIKSIVLKVGHHGSKSSTTKKFLDVVAPKEALISCGSGNSYGHPNKSVTGRLEKAGARIYRTDRDGTITIKTDGKTYQVIKEH